MSYLVVILVIMSIALFCLTVAYWLLRVRYDGTVEVLGKVRAKYEDKIKKPKAKNAELQGAREEAFIENVRLRTEAGHLKAQLYAAQEENSRLLWLSATHDENPRQDWLLEKNDPVAIGYEGHHVEPVPGGMLIFMSNVDGNDSGRVTVYFTGCPDPGQSLVSPVLRLSSGRLNYCSVNVSGVAELISVNQKDGVMTIGEMAAIVVAAMRLRN